MYKKILVPLDGSAHATRALQEAIKVAKMTQGTITLLNVTPTGSSVISTTKQKFYEILQNEGKNALAAGKKLAASAGLEVEVMLVEGDAIGQITKTAKNGNYDLIVMGARGIGTLSELVLGSVSHGVIKNAHCPVLVTR
ncbi:MAG: universal stress protein [Candidatus Bathyarchaeota archaeon]|nr:universal stress protein [Candidatus Bathyarchaeota archaeon]